MREIIKVMFCLAIHNYIYLNRITYIYLNIIGLFGNEKFVDPLQIPLNESDLNSSSNTREYSIYYNYAMFHCKEFGVSLRATASFRRAAFVDVGLITERDRILVVY